MFLTVSLGFTHDPVKTGTTGGTLGFGSLVVVFSGDFLIVVGAALGAALDAIKIH